MIGLSLPSPLIHDIVLPSDSFIMFVYRCEFWWSGEGCKEVDTASPQFIGITAGCGVLLIIAVAISAVAHHSRRNSKIHYA